MQTTLTSIATAAMAALLLSEFPLAADPLVPPRQPGISQSMTAEADTLAPINAGSSVTYSAVLSYYDAWNNPQTCPAHSVSVLNPKILSASVAAGNVTLTALEPGITSVTFLKDPSVSDGPSAVSYGIMVCQSDGTKPLLPPYPFLSARASMGNTDVEGWYQGVGLSGLEARRTDAIDIYLTGGPDDGILTSATDYHGFPGVTPTNFIRACKRQGRIPAIVLYSIEPLGADDSARMALSAVCGIPGSFVGADYMTRYYHRTVRLLREVLARTVSDGWPAIVVVEPDFIGYMASGFPGGPIDPDATLISANGTDASGAFSINGTIQVGAAFQPGPAGNSTDGSGQTFVYDTSPLLDSSDLATCPDTLAGFVKSIPRILKKQFTLSGNSTQLGPNVLVGWEINAWASRQPDGFSGNMTVPTGNAFGNGKGLLRWTDVAGGQGNMTFSQLVGLLQAESAGIALYYKSARVDVGTDFISFDRYGSDGGSKFGTTGGGTESDPGSGTYFLNSDHWNNYLAYIQKVQSEVPLPAIIWQANMGHINATNSTNPDGGPYTPLSNAASSGSYEDSSSTFWFGDTFTVDSPQRLAYFSQNLWAQVDPDRSGDVSVSGSTITWKPALLRLQGLNILGLMCGAGVGMAGSTVATAQGSAVSCDDLWWINKAQRYYSGVDSPHAPALLRAEGGRGGHIDTDADGLPDYDEITVHATALYEMDSNNDGLLDGDSLALGLDPGANHSAAFAYGQSQVTSDPASYGLYTPDSIQDLNMGGVMLQVAGNGTASLMLQLQATSDLASQPFVDTGDPIEIPVSLSGNRTFLRVRALGPR